MVGKSKGKQKALQGAEVSVLKTAADNGKALEITKRLRKGHNLEPLLKEAEDLARQHSSAISKLCHAKVALAKAVEGLMSTSLTEQESRPAIHKDHKDQLQAAMQAAREGALNHCSILCGRFYYKLAEIVEPNFAGINWPHPNTLADPHTELLEQVHREQELQCSCVCAVPSLCILQDPNLCDFETWKEWKNATTENLKLKMRLEMEKCRKKGLQRHSENAADIAEGIMRSGLLYDSAKQHLSRALGARQTRLQSHEKTMAQKQAHLIQVTFLACECCSAALAAVPLANVFHGTLRFTTLTYRA